MTSAAAEANMAAAIPIDSENLNLRFIGAPELPAFCRPVSSDPPPILHLSRPYFKRGVRRGPDTGPHPNDRLCVHARSTLTKVLPSLDLAGPEIYLVFGWEGA